MRRHVTVLALVALASLALAAVSLAAKPVASASPSRLSFGEGYIGASPTSQMVEFKNRTKVYIQLTTVDWPTGFVLGYPEYPAYNTCAAPYVTQPGGTCSLYVAFAPTALGRAPPSLLVLVLCTPFGSVTAPMHGGTARNELGATADLF